jgi:hypothetical protein
VGIREGINNKSKKGKKERKKERKKGLVKKKRPNNLLGQAAGRSCSP